MVDVFITAKRGKFDQTLKTIRNKKYNISTANKPLNEIYLNFKGLKEKSPEFKKIKKILDKMRGIDEIEILQRHLKRKNTTLKDALATNQCRIIFDIDSTLTRGNPGTIHSSIALILHKIQDKGIWVYVATGRAPYDLAQIVSKYPIQKNSIAENGGIILGFTADGYLEFGDKTEPLKILNYLQKKYRVKEDMKQGERITEVIFLQSDVSEKMLKEARKKTKAKVDVHASQNSNHISAKGINKGTALLELATRLKWGNSFKIAVGDSQMDVAMFNAADYSFAPKNADKHAKEACNEVLNGNYEKAIANLYALIVKSS